ncbi:MAG: hypothetical protein NTZ49_00745 [Candidatus Parcubacteria bacterium]|nr:hypothetical protein [Candidatus Parcubacteria bacterium]
MMKKETAYIVVLVIIGMCFVTFETKESEHLKKDYFISQNNQETMSAEMMAYNAISKTLDNPKVENENEVELPDDEEQAIYAVLQESIRLEKRLQSLHKKNKKDLTEEEKQDILYYQGCKLYVHGKLVTWQEFNNLLPPESRGEIHPDYKSTCFLD